MTDSTLRNNADESRYELVVDDSVAGIAEYRAKDGLIELLHTEVDSSYAGQGLGSRLARGVLDDIRGQGLALVPYCRFIRSYLKRHPEYVEMVPADQRSELGIG
ncbi:MAG: GNAT family N-acetyltransferase [Nocardioidaceae bacterium]